jgi:hypothetical protein
MESTLSAIAIYLFCPLAGLIALLLIIGALCRRALTHRWARSVRYNCVSFAPSAGQA